MSSWPSASRRLGIPHDSFTTPASSLFLDPPLDASSPRRHQSTPTRTSSPRTDPIPTSDASPRTGTSGLDITTLLPEHRSISASSVASLPPARASSTSTILARHFLETGLSYLL
ncbi:hypothetical protein M430DRAFT_245910 [Amorphotheca resinae ATCC 22711]|uniref:Uncharacterized protein n=1 Tax=Amorphotheca resinae ATCC 22711 TaxID=857342 RepID=A0A2T3AZI8_AMORE|nr:hypothetical protein M430DRAFT_245910 [Amorphotheca resinae ATCC 22711]PSS16576.1 hypothetical protein M430DRAFT_245910 [Amorphotheca resinae ATCC 22711]